MFGKNSSAGAGGKRRSTRRRAFFSGRIVRCDDLRASDCMIRDISETGALIEIKQSEVVPEKFFLLGSRTESAFEAELVWRKGNLAGLRFLREHNLVTSGDAQMLRLKYLSPALARIGPRTSI